MGYDYVPRLSASGIPQSGYYNTVPYPWSGGLGSITPLMHYYGRTRPPRGNCTSYCVGRWLEICKGDKSKMEGLLSRRNTGTWDGGAWYECSPSLQVRSGGPQLGDIVCISIGNTWNGHVFVVEELHEDYIVCSQSEYHGVFFHVTQNYRANNYMGKWYTDRGYKLRGFIRMKDVPSSPITPDYDMPTEWVVKLHYYDMTDEDKENNAVMAAVQLYSYGWTLEAIAGALGNFQRESNIDPQSTGSGGCGLVGWTPPRIFTTWANHYGYTWYDGEKQIEFINADIFVDKDVPYLADGSLNLHPQWIAKASFGWITYEEYKTMTETPEEMAEIFMLGYERPGEPALEERKANARRWYDFLQGINLPFWNFPKNQPYKDGLSVWQMAGNAKPKLIY